MKKKIIFSLCIMTLLMTGCGKVAKLSNGQELVAEVNGTKITVDELYNKIKLKYATNTLIDMIDTAILDKEYKTDDEMNTYVNNQVASFKQQLGDNFLSTIKSQAGLNSEEELFQYLLLNYKRNLAIKDYVKGKITDAEIQTYYNDKTVGDIRASHILIKPNTTSKMTDAEKTAKEKEAENLAKEIITKLNNGEKFADLAKKYSGDGSASKGGDLGWFNKNDANWDESFRNAAYNLKKDEYTKTPVKSQYGYHIILKTDEKAKPTLEQAKDGIIDAIVTSKLSDTSASNTLKYEALENLRTSHKLTIHDSELKKQYDDYMKSLKSAQ